MKTSKLFLSALVVASIGLSVFAQTQDNKQITATTREEFMKTGVGDLMFTLRGLHMLDRNKDTAISKEQAAKLVPVLQKLQGLKTLDDTNAADIAKALKATLSKAQTDALAAKFDGKGRDGQGNWDKDGKDNRDDRRGGRGGDRRGGRGGHGDDHGGRGGDRDQKPMNLEGNPFAADGFAADRLADFIKDLQAK